MTLSQIGFYSAVVLALGCLVVVVLLVLVRVSKDRSERRRLLLRAPAWRHVLMLSTGEPDEAEAALATLLSLGAADRAAIEADAFGLVLKLRGAARDRLRDVLRSWGSLDDAVRGTTSRSAVRRCRALYRLGVLAEAGSQDAVLACLDDREFGVRRTAVLALGSFPDAEVVENLLRRASLEPRLRRDFLASIDRIGNVAVPVLREGLTRTHSEQEGSERRRFLAAEALGLVGAIQAVASLEAAMEGSSVELKIACIESLGDLGASTSVGALSDALAHSSPDVRRVAAQALGMVGGERAVPVLTTVLDDDNVEVARAAANALRRCSAAGREVLAASAAPVALEVVALAALGEA